ncbi:hypothetical protein PDIG_02660 [Penicillium digitatum PHI26]|uniref:Uncharacterized protein n=1 Tax=Penicillium digitatum (strain PHI26 / CECT 20796) TaxID=1170229 RepID=K9GEK4_PEND2|nr:hypothetical protein PDIG_02660 [Penicillium digitatum PHI26]
MKDAVWLSLLVIVFGLVTSSYSSLIKRLPALSAEREDGSIAIVRVGVTLWLGDGESCTAETITGTSTQTANISPGVTTFTITEVTTKGIIGCHYAPTLSAVADVGIGPATAAKAAIALPANGQVKTVTDYTTETFTSCTCTDDSITTTTTSSVFVTTTSSVLVMTTSVPVTTTFKTATNTSSVPTTTTPTMPTMTTSVTPIMSTSSMPEIASLSVSTTTTSTVPKIASSGVLATTTPTLTGTTTPTTSTTISDLTTTLPGNTTPSTTKVKTPTTSSSVGVTTVPMSTASMATGGSTVTIPNTTINLLGTTLPRTTITTIITEPTNFTVSNSSSILPGSTRTPTITGPGSPGTVGYSTTIINTVTIPSSQTAQAISPSTTATVSGPDASSTQSSGSATTVSASVCSSLISNPSYTPTATLPDDYTWGCAPGYLCKPRHTGNRSECNIEAGLPNPGYICAPSDCIVAPSLDAHSSWQYDISNNYYNLNPEDFGLNYSIFQFTDDPIAANNKRDMSLWDFGVAQKVKTVDITNIPAVCYNDCNDAAHEPQLLGKTSELCKSDSAFMENLESCNECITNNAESGSDQFSSKMLPTFAQWLNFCSDLATSTTTQSATSTKVDTAAIRIQTITTTSTEVSIAAAITSTQALQASSTEASSTSTEPTSTEPTSTEPTSTEASSTEATNAETTNAETTSSQSTQETTTTTGAEESSSLIETTQTVSRFTTSTSGLSRDKLSAGIYRDNIITWLTYHRLVFRFNQDGVEYSGRRGWGWKPIR